jgi:hypothetical protein
MRDGAVNLAVLRLLFFALRALIAVMHAAASLMRVGGMSTPTPAQLALTGGGAISDARPAAAVAPAGSAPHSRARTHAPLLAALWWLSFPLGAGVIALAYQIAARGQTGDAVFVLFWAGVAIACVPAVRQLLDAEATEGRRLALLVGIGLLTFLPKYLRNPVGPLFHDELAHWRAIQDSWAAHHLMQASPIIPIIQHFPGLHAAVIVLRELTGASTFTAGEVLLLGLHTSALVGVYVLVKSLLADQRLAAVGAVVYGLNPGFMFFDVQLAYESLGITLVIWALAFAASVDSIDARASWRSAAIACLIGGACVVTHHLSSYFLVVMLLALAVAATVSRRPRHALAAAWTVATVVGGLAVAWAVPYAGHIWHYISPYFASAWHQLVGNSSGGGIHHSPFSGSSLPPWERALGFAAPVVALTTVALGLRALTAGRRWNPRVTIFFLLACVYLASLPFVLVTAGNEAARRSWSFTYLGIATVAPLALASLFTRTSGPRARLITALVAFAAAALLVGNVATSVNEDYRFPGPLVYGSDSRSMTPELTQLSSWFRGRFGGRNRVLADRSTGLALGTLGGQTVDSPSPGFPVWQLFLSTRPVETLMRDVAVSGWRLLVVDRRQAQSLPRIGFYVDPKEPGAYDHQAPPPASLIDRYRNVLWAAPVAVTPNYTVYRLDPVALSMTIADPFRTPTAEATP